MIKHATASVFVFDRVEGEWRLGLVHHPRLGRWMVPGGHVEPDENVAEAAVREVAEEIGCDARLLATSPAPPTLGEALVLLPFVIVEQLVPSDREPSEHIHVDHLYVAVAGAAIGEAELQVAWRRVDELAGLHLFEDTRRLAVVLFDGLDDLVAGQDDGEAIDHG
jgi:8-oxo-dGTP pyrophosphatase MutT (NUDIX family)